MQCLRMAARIAVGIGVGVQVFAAQVPLAYAASVDPPTGANVSAAPAVPAAGVVVPTPAATATVAAPAPIAAPALAPLPTPLPTPLPMPPQVVPPAASSHGVAVVAFPGAADAAWPLAQTIYSDGALRADGLDEAYARVLCGDSAPKEASASLRDLADTVAALRSDDAPSRALLDAIARRFSVRALVVVGIDGGHPVAHVFLPESATFDAAAYAPDGGPGVSWSGAERSIARLFAPPPAPAATRVSANAPALATHEAPRTERTSPSRPFYESGWFWGGLGAAALAAGAIYLATRDSSSPTIHLEVQVPH